MRSCVNVVAARVCTERFQVAYIPSESSVTSVQIFVRKHVSSLAECLDFTGCFVHMKSQLRCVPVHTPYSQQPVNLLVSILIKMSTSWLSLLYTVDVDDSFH